MTTTERIYTIAEMLDVGVKLMQFPLEDELQIRTTVVEDGEKIARVSRIARHVVKKESKREERHVRHEQQREYVRKSAKSDDGAIMLNLAEETPAPTAEEKAAMKAAEYAYIQQKQMVAQEIAIAQQVVAQELAVQQLVAATAMSQQVAALARKSQFYDKKKSVVENESRKSSKRVQLSISEKIADSAENSPYGNHADQIVWPFSSVPFSNGNVNYSKDVPYQTVMLRNIPNKYTRSQLLKRFDDNFKGEFDFLYVPTDFNNKCNIGYAFLNFKRHDSVARFLQHFNGVNASICLPDYNSSKVCEVTPAHVQGLELTIEHLRSSPIAEQLRSKPEWQPLLFDANGEPMAFPLNPNRPRGSEKKFRSTTASSAAASPISKKSMATEGEVINEDSQERESFPKKEKRRKEKNRDNSTAARVSCTIIVGTHTTAMIRYIPEEITRTELNTRLSKLLPKGSYDFLYMPIDFEKNNNVGYFFLNFRDPNAIAKCVEVFHNKPCKEVFETDCEDYIEVSPARVQGLEMNTINVKNSSVGAIGQSNLEWKPLLYSENGESEELKLANEGDDKNKGKKRKKSEVSPKGGEGRKVKMSKSVSGATSASLSTKDDKRRTWSATQTTVYEDFKTVMLRHLPNKYSRQMLQDRLDALGFKDEYDLLYLPIDSRNKCNIGYAFVNFRTNDGVTKCFREFQGVESTKCLPGYNSNKIVEVTPARVQGLEANVRHMQTSAVVQQLQDKPDWMPIVLDSNHNVLEYPWKEVITTNKLNALAPVFQPEKVASTGNYDLPSLQSILNPVNFEQMAHNRWVLAMELMCRTQMLGPVTNEGGAWDEKHQATHEVNPNIHTTLMIRNIPNKFTRDKLLFQLKETLPKNSIDFFYIPIDLKNKCNMGYCFVNFRSVDGVKKCVERFHNVQSYICLPSFNSSKICVVTAARRQGLKDNVLHLVNESVVFQTLTKRSLHEWLPLLFDPQGNEMEFPRTPEQVAFWKSSNPKKSKKSATSKTSQKSGRSTERKSTTKEFSSYYGQVLDYVDPAKGNYTTVMVRNLPATVRRSHLISELEVAGLKGDFDFIYLPRSGEKEEHVGCAFVNLRTSNAVQKLVKHLNNAFLNEFSSSEALEVSPARVQGLEANIRHLSNSGVLDKLDLKGEWVPAVFDDNGDRIARQISSRRPSSVRANAPTHPPLVS